MDIVDQLAEMMVKEYEQKGKRLSFELARLTVQAKTCDGMVRAMLRDPEMSAEKMADFLNVSAWFVKVSISRYERGKRVDPKPAAKEFSREGIGKSERVSSKPWPERMNFLAARVYNMTKSGNE